MSHVAMRGVSCERKKGCKLKLKCSINCIDYNASKASEQETIDLQQSSPRTRAELQPAWPKGLQRSKLRIHKEAAVGGVSLIATIVLKEHAIREHPGE